MLTLAEAASSLSYHFQYSSISKALVQTSPGPVRQRQAICQKFGWLSFFLESEG